jgi:hypothetical protein
MSLILLKDIPDLEKDFEVESINLASEYWTPEKEGEKRRMIFMGLEVQSTPDHNDPDKSVDLLCAVFVMRGEDNEFRTVVNGSKRLVGMFENGKVDKGKPVQITYLGKKKNRNNANMSDSWDVRTLKPKGK